MALSNNRYRRDQAAQYALKFALKPNPAYKYFEESGEKGGDCSNFISQCLRAGGAPMDFGGRAPWWYDDRGSYSTADDKCSLSWSVANSLFWCLKSREKLGLSGLKVMEVPYMGLLEIGDIIQYERDNRIYHSAMITSFIGSGNDIEPLISQHTYNAINITYFKPKAQKMHFMKIIVT